MADNTITKIEEDGQKDGQEDRDYGVSEPKDGEGDRDHGVSAEKDGHGNRDHDVSEAQAEAVMTSVSPQGHGGQPILLSVIPCIVFYCLWKLYFRRLQHRVSRTLWGREAFISSRAFVGDSAENLQDIPQDNVIEMRLAENQLSRNLVQEWFASHPKATIDPSSLRQVAGNNDNDGMPALKTAVAAYMSQVMKRKELFNESRIVLTAGCSSAMEILSFCLSEQTGDAFLVPSPYNPSFNQDIKWRTGVELVPVHCRRTRKFSITIPALEVAYNRSRRRLNICAILISNPSNPVGKILNSDTLESLLHFAIEKDIDLICDETQAGSVCGSQGFTSITQVLDSEKFECFRSRVHIICDLGIPEFRVGVLYSYNDEVIKAARKLVRFSPVSSPTQCCLLAMLSDAQFLEKYIAENQKRLCDRFCEFTRVLDQMGIKYIREEESHGGVYCWVELGSLMQSYNVKGELNLWKRLLSEAKVNVTPGSACHCIEPGWFRFCFATVRNPEMSEALDRIQKHFLLRKSEAEPDLGIGTDSETFSRPLRAQG